LEWNFFLFQLLFEYYHLNLASSLKSIKIFHLYSLVVQKTPPNSNIAVKMLLTKTSALELAVTMLWASAKAASFVRHWEHD
jgi:hypothetical protein